MKSFYVYILASRPGGAIYIGVTSSLARRVWEHREGLVRGHTQRFNIKMLVYYEVHEVAEPALQRESTLKHWPRKWKTDLIVGFNPTWRDLYEDLAL